MRTDFEVKATVDFSKIQWTTEMLKVALKGVDGGLIADSTDCDQAAKFVGRLGVHYLSVLLAERDDLEDIHEQVGEFLRSEKEVA